jgi:hypothetical protein
MTAMPTSIHEAAKKVSFVKEKSLVTDEVMGFL